MTGPSAPDDGSSDSSRPDDAGEVLTPEFLAALHSARQVHAAAANSAAARALAQSTVTVAELWKHARRRPGEPVSFALERAIRTDDGLAQRYGTMLKGFAAAHAPMAIAASDGSRSRRRVGPYSFERIEDGGMPMLLIRTDQGAKQPDMIELNLGGRILRIAPGESVGGAAVLALDPGFEESRLLAEMMADPATEIFVF